MSRDNVGAAATCECMSCINRLGPAHCETVEQMCCGTRYPIRRPGVYGKAAEDREASENRTPPGASS